MTCFSMGLMAKVSTHNMQLDGWRIIICIKSEVSFERILVCNDIEKIDGLCALQCPDSN